MPIASPSSLPHPNESWITPVAKAGLASKGIVYCLLGLLTCMAAFRINGTSDSKTDKGGVFDFIHRQSGGGLMLGAIALGLACYVIWRFIQTFRDTEHKGRGAKGLAARARYFFSGLVYGSVALQIVRILTSGNTGRGDQQQDLAQELLSRPYGQWLVGIGAAILLCVGMYQLYYGLSEKYRKHVDEAGAVSGKKTLLLAGKTGYVARGIVWVLLAWLFFRAAIHANAAEAGDTSKAFAFLHQASYGSILLAVVGFGLICYGGFSFVRARYERFT